MKTKLLLLLALAACLPLASLRATDHFIQSAGLPWYKNVNPHGVYHNGKTYVAFEHISNDPYIMAYDHAAGTWSEPVKVGTNPLDGDNHGNPAMWIDPDGYIHVVYGGHGVPSRDREKHAKSTNPEDITSWTELPVIDDTFTYAQVCRFANDPQKVLIFYRRGTQGDGSFSGPWGYKLSTDGGNTFGAFVQVTDGSTMDMYAQAAVAPNGSLHVCIAEATAVSGYGRDDVYYLYRDTDDTWRKANGDAVTTFPVDENYVKSELRVYETSDDGPGFTPSMEFDSDSTLYIGFNDAGTGQFISGKKPYADSSFSFTQVADGCDIWSDDAWIFVASAQEMYFYVGAHGEGGPLHNGGILEEWTSTDGENWTFSRTITDFDHAWAVTRIHNAHNDAKILFTRTDNWNLYLHGDSGYLGNTIPSITVTQTGSNGTTEDWNTAADWGGSPTTSVNDYVTAAGLFLRGGPSSTGAASTFGGGSLEVIEGSLLNLKNWDTASTINGAFTLSGGQLGHLPNSGAGAPFSATFNTTSFTTSGDCDISIGGASSGLTINANLTGSGDLHFGNSENDATDVVSFAGIDSFTGTITIGDHGSSVFGTGWDIEGALTLSLGTSDFTFSDTVTILGSSVLQVNSGQTLTFAEGDLIDPVNGAVAAGTYTTADLGANYTGEGTVVVTSAGTTFAGWISDPVFGIDPADQDLTDDPDVDGLDNALEAFFGTDPGLPNPGLAQTVFDASGTDPTFSFTHPNPDTPVSDVTGSYQWSLDLNEWNASGATVNGTTATIAASPNDPAANTTTVTCTITNTTPIKLFVRVTATGS